MIEELIKVKEISTPVPEVSLVQAPVVYKPTFKMKPHYLYYKPPLHDHGKNYSLDNQDFELSNSTLKVLDHPCIEFIDNDFLEYVIDKLQKLYFQHKNRPPVDLLTLIRPFIERKDENRCKYIIRMLP